MMRSLCLVAICSLAALSGVHAQEVLELPQCDRLFEGYDALTVPAKQARIAQIGACYQRYTDAVINRKYREIIARVAQWEVSARTAVRTEIAAKAETETALLASQQRIEIAELEQRYEGELRQILAQATPENRQATNAARNELRVRGTAERAELGAQHESDSLALNSSIRAAYLKADEELAKLVDPDRMSLAQQHQDKLRHSGNLFGSFIDTPMEESIKDHDAGEPIGRITNVAGKVVIVNRNRESRDATNGGEIFLGETIRTESQASVSILFVDQTTFQISQNANLLIDEFVFDPTEEDGRTWSWLQSMFVYVSGLIGKDPDDSDRKVNISYGCICIRG